MIRKVGPNILNGYKTHYPQIKSQDLLLPIAKNENTLHNQTQTRPKKVKGFSQKKTLKTVSLDNTKKSEGKWLLGLTILETFISIE